MRLLMVTPDLDMLVALALGLLKEEIEPLQPFLLDSLCPRDLDHSREMGDWPCYQFRLLAGPRDTVLRRFGGFPSDTFANQLLQYCKEGGSPLLLCRPRHSNKWTKMFGMASGECPKRKETITSFIPFTRSVHQDSATQGHLLPSL